MLHRTLKGRIAKSFAAAVALMIAISGLAFASARSSADTPQKAHGLRLKAQVAAASSPLAEATILRIGQTVGAQQGDPSPTLIQHSDGTREQANLLASGETVPGTEVSTLIVERGHFVANNVPRPQGASPPQGDVLTIVVDVATGQVTDLGIQQNAPRLANLGPVTTDLSVGAVQASARHGRRAAHLYVDRHRGSKHGRVG